jgi:hypothetical protein
MFAESAKERMLAGKAPDPMAPVPQGTARDQAAAAVGVSRRTLQDAKTVLAKAPPEAVEKIREGKSTVKAEAKKIVAEHKPAKPAPSVSITADPPAPIEQVRLKPPSAIKTAIYDAISVLQRMYLALQLAERRNEPSSRQFIDDVQQVMGLCAQIKKLAEERQSEPAPRRLKLVEEPAAPTNGKG